MWNSLLQVIKERLKKADLKLIQGVFNKNSAAIKEARRQATEDKDNSYQKSLEKENKLYLARE